MRLPRILPLGAHPVTSVHMNHMEATNARPARVSPSPLLRSHARDVARPFLACLATVMFLWFLFLLFLLVTCSVIDIIAPFFPLEILSR